MSSDIPNENYEKRDVLQQNKTTTIFFSDKNGHII